MKVHHASLDIDRRLMLNRHVYDIAIQPSMSAESPREIFVAWPSSTALISGHERILSHLITYGGRRELQLAVLNLRRTHNSTVPFLP